MNINKVKRLLDSQYQELECGDDNVKFNVLYNVIVTKKDFHIMSYHNSLYIDIKKFIYAYIKATQSLDYGYDAINNDKIKEVVSFFNTQRAVINLSHFTNIIHKFWFGNRLDSQFSKKS